MTRRRIVWASSLAVALLALAVFLYTPGVWRWRSSPDGKHYLEVSVRSYHGLIPAFPGQGSDRPGFITVFTAEGKRCGRAPIPMLWMADEFRWAGERASIKLVAEWDLKNCRIIRQ